MKYRDSAGSKLNRNEQLFGCCFFNDKTLSHHYVELNEIYQLSGSDLVNAEGKITLSVVCLVSLYIYYSVNTQHDIMRQYPHFTDKKA